MTAQWWGKESTRQKRARLVRGRGPSPDQPELMASERDIIATEARGRINSYTPEWTNLRAGDAGVALVQLFSELAEPIVKRLNRLPEKAFVEFLRLAGVQPLAATSAKAMLEFEVAEGAPQSVFVGKGFQVGAKPATGEGDQVVFETENNLYAAPASIEEMHVQQGGVFTQVDVNSQDPNARFLPFGKKPEVGNALLIGLASDIVPGPFISLGVSAATATDAPPPASSGSLTSLLVPPPPVLRWEILDGANFEPADVVRDQTGALLQSGIIEISLPRQWRVGRPDGLRGDKLLRWLRVRLVFGEYQKALALSFIKLNMVEAIAARTIRNEILEHVSAPGGVARRTGNTRMRLSQTPVLPGSLTLEVGEGEFTATGAEAETQAGEFLESSASAEPQASRWRAVDDLSLYGPEDKVYVLDPATGEVTFGEGLHGAAVPVGFRNVRAVSYRVGGGAAGAVDAEAINTLISSAPSIKGVKNPVPASGGSNAETQQAAMRRSPQEIRARSRAVTTADYALMALRAEGALVERAHAISGLHPTFAGTPIPGVVALFVVPPDRGEGPPTPDEGTLQSVARFLTEKAAPAGVEVVAAAPNYHRVRCEVGVIIDPTASVGDVVRAVVTCLNNYLHPLKGGDDGQGWPFGGTLHYTALLQRLILNVKGVRAVPRLNIVIDGLRIPGCSDYPISPYSLFWPEGHEVVVVESAEAQ
ncbi:MAG TPA: putative baseplate assembly protein [Blastocatellia bacterium]|nr:putative baseplate assembly protein [Blastocatellia bacterium]